MAGSRDGNNDSLVAVTPQTVAKWFVVWMGGYTGAWKHQQMNDLDRSLISEENESNKIICNFFPQWKA